MPDQQSKPTDLEIYVVRAKNNSLLRASSDPFVVGVYWDLQEAKTAAREHLSTQENGAEKRTLQVETWENIDFGSNSKASEKDFSPESSQQKVVEYVTSDISMGSAASAGSTSETSYTYEVWVEIHDVRGKMPLNRSKKRRFPANTEAGIRKLRNSVDEVIAGMALSLFSPLGCFHCWKDEMKG